jgi:sugar transferase (PEP-CTERM/EpsH1 system associated)
VHTRNLGPLEMQPLAAFSGVQVRIHGEHGRELDDLDGSNWRYQWLRRAYAPFVHRFVALSKDLEQYLERRVGVSAERIAQIYNGVDCERFRPADDGQTSVPGWPFADDKGWYVGTVGRMQGVKHQTLLAHAFVRALDLLPSLRGRLRLVMIGEGPLREQVRAICGAAGLDGSIWLPGAREDVAAVMRRLDCFVLPSLAEGISNTILEAMACGLPVIATDVGGNAELVEDSVTGEIVPSDDVDALAASLAGLASDPRRAVSMGQAGLLAVRRRFSLQAMVSAYQDLYDGELGSCPRSAPA